MAQETLSTSLGPVLSAPGPLLFCRRRVIVVVVKV
jgi:hypothetical protein